MNFSSKVLFLTTWSCMLQVAVPFSPTTRAIQHTSRPINNFGVWNPLRAVSVPASELEKDLTPAERSVTSVVRKCGPAVAYVTSVLPGTVLGRQGRRRNGTNNNNNNSKKKPAPKDSLPEGMSLGSGSGFLISQEGYVCTNFHVIERAYTTQKAIESAQEALDKLDKEFLSKYLTEDISKSLISKVKEPLSSEKPPEVYVRINSATKYKKCQIVQVEPDLDLAVLKITENGNGGNDDNNSSSNNSDDATTVEFGSSTDLIVGQSLVAIGNPFGLDKTVTTGVVSAVNREFRAGTVRTPANRPIRNCIQTDAAINPGNSGGPLLNLKGEVVGINTAIISTSGSNAGIGFAVPSDQLRPVVERILRDDRIKDGKRPNGGWLGVSIVQKPPKVVLDDDDVDDDATTTSSSSALLYSKNWVASVAPNSPAYREGIVPLQILPDSGRIELGDAIVAVAGNEVSTWEELQTELQDRVTGENIALTLENVTGDRRVVYVTLEDKPAKKDE